MKFLNHKKKGFSLMEMIISIFVFSLIFTTVIAVFTNVIHTRKKAKDIQTQMETVRTAMDEMAKNIRMSSEVEGSSSVLDMYNNSQGICIRYKIDSTNNKITKITGGPDSGDVKCSTSHLDSYGDGVSIIENIPNLGGQFSLTKTDLISVLKTMGKVTIAIWSTGSSPFNVQTTVSLRDYENL